MYVYIGNGMVLDDRNIVGVFDLDNTSWSIHTRKFLSSAEKKNQLLNAAEDIPKSFVVCENETVILTQPNTAILARRLNNQEKWNG